MDWIAGWSKRIKLTISGSYIEEDLSDFPIMVHLDSTCSGVFNELGSNSKRILVVTSEQKQCYVEVERWDEAVKDAWLWIKVPTLASGVNSYLYLYYDNVRSDNSSYVGTVGEVAAQNVWDSNFVGVWHMNQDPSGVAPQELDSTSNNNNGTSNGDMTSDDLVEGQIAKALDFDGSNDYLNCGADASLDINDEIMIEAWVKPEVLNSNHVIVAKRDGASSSNYQVYFDDSGKRLSFYNGGSEYYSSFVPDVGVWIYVVVMVNDNVSAKFYVDNVLKSTIENVAIGNTNTAPLQIGGRTVGKEIFNGIIDEVHISNIARSPAWIKVTYYSEQNQLLNYGNEEVNYEAMAPGFLSGWKNRLKLTIQNDYIDSELINFPVMIHLSGNSGLNNYDSRSVFYELETDINRKKIAITDSTGISQCFVEIEKFSCAETEAVLWTKLPFIYIDVATHFYLYYDKTHADNVSFVGDVNSIVAQNVWDSNFVGVWHMNQDPSGGIGCIKDSTFNVNHATSSGSMSSVVDGEIGKALDFDGSDDCIKNTSNSFSTRSVFTLESIVKLAQSGVNQQFIVLEDIADTEPQFFIRATTNDYAQVYCRGNSSDTPASVTDNIGLNDNSCYYIAGTVDGDIGKVELFIEGNCRGSITQSQFTLDTMPDIVFGALSSGTSSEQFFKGIIDEVRISNVIRSPAWIKATYHSNKDSLVVFGERGIVTSWLDDWAHRIKLTIDHTKIDTNLTDFPVLITLTSDVQSDFFSEMSSFDRKKIAATKNDKITQIPIEIEQWDFYNGEVNLWVKVPTIASGIDTDIYLYYDSGREDNNAYVGDVGSVPAQGVWDTNFKGVWHMNQDPSGAAPQELDSTSNNNDGTSNGSMTSDDLVDGKIGKALDFDGSDDYINCGDDTSLNTPDAITIEALINKVWVDVNNHIVGKFNSSLDGWYLAVQYAGSSANKEYVSFRTDSNTQKLAFKHGIGDNEWGLITITWDGNTITGYVDGVYKAEASMTNLQLVSHAVWIGTWDRSGNNYFDGIIDELHISNIARSPAWIKATYHSNRNTLLTYGSVQNYISPPDYYYHGYVKEKGVYVSRKVYLYRRDTGVLVDSCMSSTNTGYYLLGTSVSGEHFIVALDDDAGDNYNALIQDRLYSNDK